MAERVRGAGADASSSSSAASRAAHSVELLAPLYRDVVSLSPIASRPPLRSARFPLTLQRAADGRIQLKFSPLEGGVRKLSTCLNGKRCACSFVQFLGDVMELEERGVLRITAEYVVHGSPEPISATIRLDVALHEDHGGRGGDVALQEFEFVLSHLQMAVLNVVEWRDRRLRAADVADAKRSACHVVGCRLHPNLGARGAGTVLERLKLAEVFHSLTSHTSVQQMEVRDDETYESRMARRGSATNGVRRVILTDLPTIALQNLVCMMNARDLAAISSVCSMFQNLAYEVVPGLNLVLYEHQRRGLKWMLRRESALASLRSTVPHPFVFPSTTSHGHSPAAGANAKVIDLVDYKLVDRSQAIVQDTRGGLFCGEPGLGKTITVMALILRTQGQRSRIDHTLESLDNSVNFHGSSSTNGLALRSSRSRGRAVAASDLVGSRASLIVVPDPLVEHWKYQIETHIAPGALRVFIDVDSKKELPSNSALARYDVVVTSFTRLTREWKFHRPPSALEMRMPDRYGFEDSAQRYADGQARGEVSSLLTINWIRVIVDEGHKLGGKSTTNIMLMARLISAERRWVMTGTPTPNTLQSADLEHMHGLLVFLRNLPYGHPDGKAWAKAIARPFEQNERIAFYRVQHMLSRIMLRHTKESIRSILPEPVRQIVLLDPTPVEFEEYNGVAASVRANLVLSYMDPHDPGSKYEESLMNPKNRSSALIVVRNLRASTCNGAEVRVLLTDKSLAETLTMLVNLGVDDDLVRLATEYMRRVVIPGLKTRCECCERMLQFLMLIPCGHLCCADCVEDTVVKDGYVCFLCRKPYDPEDFQRLQPGLEYSRIEDDEVEEGRPNNQRQRQGLLGGRQGGGHQGGGRQGEGRQEGGRRQPPNRNRQGDEQQQHGDQAAQPRGFTPIDYTLHFDAIRASKAMYAVARIRELRDEFARANTTMGHRPRPRYVKAIIFSQFKEHIWKIRIAFAQQGIETANFVSGLSPEARMRELVKFRADPSVSVLLLTEIGSHGLDLSFVTHVFLMEEIWDKSLEQQVISRAHRMGAKQSVVVEQLVMRDSVESLMRTMNERGLDVIRDEEEEKEKQLLMAYTRAGLSSRVAASSGYVLPPEASMRSPGRKSNTMFGASSKKRKRQANGDAGALKDRDGKVSALQQRLHYVLTNLRLLDASVRAEPDQVRFMVLNENHKIIRRGIHLIQGPSERVVTSSVEFTEESAATYEAPKTRTADAVLVPSRSPTTRSPALPNRPVKATTTSPATPSARVLQRQNKAPQLESEIIVIDSSSSESDKGEEGRGDDTKNGSDLDTAAEAGLDCSNSGGGSSSSNSDDDEDDLTLGMMVRAHKLMKRRKRAIDSSDEEKKESEPKPPPAKQQRTETQATAPDPIRASPRAPPTSQQQQANETTTAPSMAHNSPSPPPVAQQPVNTPTPSATSINHSIRFDVVTREVARIAGRAVSVVTIDTDEDDDMDVSSEATTLPQPPSSVPGHRDVSIMNKMFGDDDSSDDDENGEDSEGGHGIDGNSDGVAAVVQREQSDGVPITVESGIEAARPKRDAVASTIASAASCNTEGTHQARARKTVRFSEVDTIHPIVMISAAALAGKEEDTESE